MKKYKTADKEIKIWYSCLILQFIWQPHYRVKRNEKNNGIRDF